MYIIYVIKVNGARCSICNTSLCNVDKGNHRNKGELAEGEQNVKVTPKSNANKIFIDSGDYVGK